MQLKKGDKFVRFSKHGNVFGIVDSIFPSYVVHSDFKYEKLNVKSTNGVIYDYNECYKCQILNEKEKELIETFCNQFKSKL